MRREAHLVLRRRVATGESWCGSVMADGGAPASDWSPGPRAGPSLAAWSPLALASEYWISAGLQGAAAAPVSGPGPVVVTH